MVDKVSLLLFLRLHTLFRRLRFLCGGSPIKGAPVVPLSHTDHAPDGVATLYTPDHPMAGELWEALRPRVEATGLLAEEWTITWPEGLD